MANKIADLENRATKAESNAAYWQDMYNKVVAENNELREKLAKATGPAKITPIVPAPANSTKNVIKETINERLGAE